MLESVINGAMLPPLSLRLLQHMAAGDRLSRIRLYTEDNAFMAEVETDA